MTASSLALFLLALPPAAALHHDRAVAHHEAGRLEQALDEFAAAYAALPDPQGDLDDREQMLGSLHGLLLHQHEQDGAARPLCRLHALLRGHVDALAAAYPEQPERRELVVNGERLAALEARLAALPADACAEAPAAVEEPAVLAEPVLEAPPPTQAPASPPLHREAPTRPRRDLRVGGVVALAVGAGLLGPMSYGLVRQRRERDQARALELEVGDTITRPEYQTLLDLRARARTSRMLALGTGLAAAASVALGATLLALNHRRARARALALAPWWLSSGAGLTLSLRLP